MVPILSNNLKVEETPDFETLVISIVQEIYNDDVVSSDSVEY